MVKKKKWKIASSMTKEERQANRILAEQWRGDWNLSQAKQSHQAERGHKKRGHEGPLKELLRDIMGKKKMSFENVCEALDVHERVENFGADTLTFFYVKDGKDLMKEVKLPAIRKAYREIIKTSP